MSALTKELEKLSADKSKEKKDNAVFELLGGFLDKKITQVKGDKGDKGEDLLYYYPIKR